VSVSVAVRPSSAETAAPATGPPDAVRTTPRTVVAGCPDAAALTQTSQASAAAALIGPEEPLRASNIVAPPLDRTSTATR
jgi:hypothetical protein